MNKKEAAAFLGISVRSVERLMGAGLLTCRYEGGRTSPRAILSIAELQTVKTMRESRPVYPQRHRNRTAAPKRRTREELHAQIQRIQNKVERLQQDLYEAVEIVLEYAGMGEGEARAWVDRNLRAK